MGKKKKYENSVIEPLHEQQMSKLAKIPNACSAC